MRSIQTDARFPLASVKPLDRLASYREVCLTLTRQALKAGCERRLNPLGAAPLEPWGQVEGLTYGRCRESGSFFLCELPDWKRWARLLSEVSRVRNSPEGFHSELASSREDHVTLPKSEWIQETLRLQGIFQPRVLEGVTPPSDFNQHLRQRGLFSEVIVADEMGLAHGAEPAPSKRVEVALLMESLDRVDDPVGLLRATNRSLQEGGLLFVTGLVSSGFDMAVLGLRNLYLYPPDRTNCFSLRGLKILLERNGFSLLEVSTPGVLDVEIVQAHLNGDPSLQLSPFERQIIEADCQTQSEFQAFLQQGGLSSFARIVARKGQMK